MENTFNVIEYQNSGKFSIDLSDKNDITISIKNDSKIDLDLVNFSDSCDLKIFAQKGSLCNLRILLKDKPKNIVLHANLDEKSEFNVYFADFSLGNSTFNSHIILLGDGAKSEFKFSSFNTLNYMKKYNLSYDHIGLKTTSNLEGYGVCLKDSLLTVNGVSHIEKDSIKSSATQKIKAILFDETSGAIANPILKIDCDDIIANHACAIGSLNDDHIFYLLSRGIKLEEARKLITYGYLSPIKEHFEEKEKEEIQNLIEGDL